MSQTGTHDIQHVQDEVQRAIQEGRYEDANKLIADVAQHSSKAEEYKRLYEEQQVACKRLEEKIAELQEPPLAQGIILGPSPDDEKNVIIGAGGQRLEVRIAADADLTPADLIPGSEAWLNKDRQIVKVREPYSSGEAGEITAILDDGRLEVKSRGNEGVVVDPIASLPEAGLQIGDRVRIDAHLAIAFEKLPTQETKELELEEVPDVTYDDIGGLDEQIEQVRDAIELPYLYNQLFRRYILKRPKGILLYGPPGCGKTMMAKAIANSLTAAITRNLQDIEMSLSLLLELREENTSEELTERYAAWHEHAWDSDIEDGEQSPASTLEEMETALVEFLDTRGIAADDPVTELEQARARLVESSRAYFMSIKGPELLNKYVGETEHSIRRLFLQAKRRASPSTPVIMFFDEIEALFRRRGSRISSDVESTVVPQFLSEIDGVEELNNVIIIGATNRQDLLDPAILRPGRLDAKIKIDRPNRDAAYAIFGKYLVPELPFDEAEVAAVGSAEAIIESVIERAVAIIYDDASVLRISGQPLGGQAKTLPWSDFVSGAMFDIIVSRAKKRALKREVDTGSKGLRWEDVRESIREEFEQNKDQLVSTTLHLPEEGLEIEVVMAEAEVGVEISPWLQPLERPWRQHIMMRELAAA